MALNLGKDTTNLPFECSQTLDKNSLKALHCDDDEDNHVSSSTYKQKQKQDALKKFEPGSTCEGRKLSEFV
jgi:hypothetical protein